MNSEFPAVNLPVRFISAGLVVSEPGWIHPKRLLNHHMVIVVKQGQFGLIVGGRPCVLSAGQALLLPSGLEHCGFPVEQESAPVFCWASFEDDSLSGRDADSLGTLLFDLPTQVFDCVVSDFHHLINHFFFTQAEFDFHTPRRIHVDRPVFIIKGVAVGLSVRRDDIPQSIDHIRIYDPVVVLKTVVGHSQGSLLGELQVRQVVAVRVRMSLDDHL